MREALQPAAFESPPPCGQHTLPLTAADIAAYQRDGAIILRRAFVEWVAPLQQGIAELMANPGPWERSVRPQDGSAPFFQDLCNWQRIAQFREFVLG